MISQAESKIEKLESELEGGTQRKDCVSFLVAHEQLLITIICHATLAIIEIDSWTRLIIALAGSINDSQLMRK